VFDSKNLKIESHESPIRFLYSMSNMVFLTLIKVLQFSKPDGNQSKTDRYLHLNKLSVPHNVGNVFIL